MALRDLGELRYAVADNFTWNCSGARMVGHSGRPFGGKYYSFSPFGTYFIDAYQQLPKPSPISCSNFLDFMILPAYLLVR
jgi:hypothetical protein